MTGTAARGIPSLVKWTGSKRARADEIASTFPAFRRYFEPFLGGGALLYRAGHPGAVAGDVYAPLIELWTLVRDEPARVVEDYRRQWTLLQADLPAYYYVVRERFNREPGGLDLNFLLRTCVNGIVRFNRLGAFNNSFHLSRRGMEPDRYARIVRRWRERLQGVELLCADFERVLRRARRGDFAYLDPPYRGNKQRYAQDLAPERLFGALERLNRRGVGWALSYDGSRGGRDYRQPVPRDLYARRVAIDTGHSAVRRVLSGPLEPVCESLYLSPPA